MQEKKNCQEEYVLLYILTPNNNSWPLTWKKKIQKRIEGLLYIKLRPSLSFCSFTSKQFHSLLSCLLKHEDGFFFSFWFVHFSFFFSLCICVPLYSNQHGEEDSEDNSSVHSRRKGKNCLVDKMFSESIDLLLHNFMHII